jgi:capsular exopolysaccharide synthesis family protein
MSQVFEALRKSEAERSGTGEVAPLAATELLKRVERSTAAQRKTEAGTVDLADQLQDEFPLPRLSGELPADSSAPEIFTSAEPAQDTAPAAVFGNFEPLQISTPAESRLASLVDKNSPAAEAFRLLAVRLRHLRRERPLKKVLITSTVPEEGKSFSSANLACALALNSQQRILLIEGDIRHPTLWQIFGAAKMPGLCEYLRDGRSIASCIYRLDRAGIWFLPAGSAQGNPLEVIQSAKFGLAMEQLAQWFDWIIVDSPPAFPMADTTTLVRLVDGIILVARRGVTRKRKLQKGMDALDPQKLIGALLNSSDGASDGDYYYYHQDSANPRKKPANAT